MATELTLLRTALEAVDWEQSMLEQECRSFQTFREAVRLATAERPDDGRSPRTAELQETYRESVMSTADFQETYGESLEESLAHELSPAAAGPMVEAAPFTHRLKRELLVQTSHAIDRRERYDAQLEAEAKSLRSALSELRDIDETVADLPDCTVRRGYMDTLIETWQTYDGLEDRCQTLLKRRQEQLDTSDRALHVPDSAHALNEYLYGDLETTYPVLSAIASMLDRIADAKGDGYPQDRKRVLTDGEGT